MIDYKKFTEVHPETKKYFLRFVDESAQLQRPLNALVDLLYSTEGDHIDSSTLENVALMIDDFLGKKLALESHFFGRYIPDYGINQELIDMELYRLREKPDDD